MLGVARTGGHVVLERGRLGAAQGGDDAGEDDRDPVAAGVDHAGLAQDRQQLGAALDRVLPGVERRLEDVGEHAVLLVVAGVGAQPRDRHVREIGDDAPGHLARDREHRALGGVADRAVGALGRAGHGRADEHRVDELARPRDQLLGRAANELGEDDARVPARAQQRGARDRVHDLVAPDLVDRAVAALALEPVELADAPRAA